MWEKHQANSLRWETKRCGRRISCSLTPLDPENIQLGLCEYYQEFRVEIEGSTFLLAFDRDVASVSLHAGSFHMQYLE
jgi:hypothetical protein